MKKIAVFFVLLSFSAQAQNEPAAVKTNGPGGTLMLGMRTTSSLFSDGGYPGMGVGGQFRLRFFDRVNSDWFADYITTDIGGLGKRTDYHIGWSVLFYPFIPEDVVTVKRGTVAHSHPRRLAPYLLAGHCFDYTRVSNLDASYPHTEERWSSAIQSGLGMHFLLSKNMDLSLTTQYMMHLGGDVHAEIIEGPSGNEVLFIEKHDDLSLEGHLLVNLSLNVRVADLWGGKK